MLQQNLESPFLWSALAKAGAFGSSALGVQAGDAVAGWVVAPKGCLPDVPALMSVAAKPASALRCLHLGLCGEKGVAGGMRAHVAGSSGPLGMAVCGEDVPSAGDGGCSTQLSSFPEEIALLYLRGFTEQQHPLLMDAPLG